VDEMMLLLWVPVGLLIGALVGQTKGRTGAGAVLGLLLGPIGWLAVALGPSMKPKCPLCGGIIVQGAIRCKNCGGDISQSQPVPKGSHKEPVSNHKQLRVRPTRPSIQNREETTPCPLCNVLLRLSSIRVGRNVCPSCKNEFEAEA
jgi:hypothetical protein